ncbi:DUF6896 domain-containing protein [Massilia endophytica]|uniref:DUF6896 domain-containing protein n=1 Tax=Massilia endophytica TaxID=2899220 RepID=UPI001E2D6F61|nr:hypothetical protein [Massilia endophytica]UGQ47309.1 hypothetical protein LSQ66_02175 [Massilia endophytica]
MDVEALPSRYQPIIPAYGPMDERLRYLIDEYQSAVKFATSLMYRSGINMPQSDYAWAHMDIAPSGTLDVGVQYHKHGAGCMVELQSGTVDFDFGANGEIDGFDLWKLTQFVAHSDIDYGFESETEIEHAYNAALQSGEMLGSHRSLHYLASGVRQYAIEVDTRLPGDKLPSKSRDPILTLYIHYFLAADLMLKNYQKLDQQWKKSGKLSRNNHIQIRIYFFTWLGYLGVICEAFNRKLKLRHLLTDDRPDRFKDLLSLSDELGKIIKAHSDPLRKFRNNVFHLRDDIEEIRKFFEHDAYRIDWAKELHARLERIFLKIPCAL